MGQGDGGWALPVRRPQREGPSARSEGLTQQPLGLCWCPAGRATVLAPDPQDAPSCPQHSRPRLTPYQSAASPPHRAGGSAGPAQPLPSLPELGQPGEPLAQRWGEGPLVSPSPWVGGPD